MHDDEVRDWRWGRKRLGVRKVGELMLLSKEFCLVVREGGERRRKVNWME